MDSKDLVLAIHATPLHIIFMPGARPGMTVANGGAAIS